MSKERFMIVDGNALLHRAWHALPPLTTSSGEIVNAVYGFLSIFLKAVKDLSPTHCAVAFDLKGPTFRHEQYAAYKATRKKQPDELYAQLDRIKEMLACLGIPRFEQSGCEADDVIATLCARLAADHPSIDIVIVTGDMDALQLVNERTRVYAPKHGISDTVLYDEQLIAERYGGLAPSQLVEFKALRGDPSDNIPGVKGIGEKTAIELVKAFGTVELILARVEKGGTVEKSFQKAFEKIGAQKDQLIQSRSLVALKYDVPLDFDFDACTLGPYRTAEIVRLFQELEFKSLIPRLADLPGFNTEPSYQSTTEEKSGERASYQAIESEKDALALFQKIRKKKAVSFDTETTSENALDADLVGVSFSVARGEASYIPWSLAGDQWKAELKDILGNPVIKKYGHNIKYDIEVMHRTGIAVSGVDFDTMLAAYIINPGTRSYGLDALAFSEFGYQKIPIASLIGRGKEQKSMAAVPLEQIAPYACEDADFCLRLREEFSKQLSDGKLEQVFRTIEMPLVEVLVAMEERGIALDASVINECAKKVKKELAEIEQKIYQLAGEEFNIASPIQLKKILFEKLGLSTQRIRKGKTGLSTAASELEKMRLLHPIIDCIVTYRECSKLLNTYIDVLPTLVRPQTGRIHTNYNQTIAATGRLSSTNPNLQNIPIRQEVGRELRKAFVAAEGYALLSADYSQIELRIAASLSKDEKMIAAFKKGVDIHTATAAEMNGIPLSDVTKDMRRAAKEINFGILFGMGPQGLAEAAGISFGDAQSFIAGYFAAYPTVRKYLDDTIKSAREMGYVETFFGRRRYMPELQSTMPQVRNAAERAAINMPIQGTGADIIKLAMIAVHNQLKKFEGAHLLLQVHDELVFEVPEKSVNTIASVMKKTMESVVTLPAPIVVDLKAGQNWGEMAPLTA